MPPAGGGVRADPSASEGPTADPARYAEWFRADLATAADTSKPGAERVTSMERLAKALEAHLSQSGDFSYSLTLGRSDPNLDPTSTNFGRITTATNSIMRFFTFVAKVSF